jgi:hypothetical protein
VDRLPQEPGEPHVSWRGYYGINSFPTVILADSGGKPYALTGNIELKVLAYVDHLQELRATHRRRDDALAKAAAATGMEKAKYLAECLTALRQAINADYSESNADPLLRFYRDEIDELVRLDPDGKAGPRPSFENLARAEKQRTDLAAFYSRVDKAYKDQGVDAALKLLDDAIATAESAELRNRFRQSRRTYLEWSDRQEEAIAYNLWQLGRVDEAVALYDEMIAEAAGDPRREFSLLWDKAEYIWHNERFAEVLAAWDRAVPLVGEMPNGGVSARWRGWGVRQRPGKLMRRSRQTPACGRSNEPAGWGPLRSCSKSMGLARRRWRQWRGRKRPSPRRQLKASRMAKSSIVFASGW